MAVLSGVDIFVTKVLADSAPASLINLIHVNIIYQLTCIRVGFDKPPYTQSCFLFALISSSSIAVRVTNYLSFKESTCRVHHGTCKNWTATSSTWSCFSIPEMSRHQKCQFQSLLLIKPRIAIRRVVEVQILLSQALTPAHTLRHRLTC